MKPQQQTTSGAGRLHMSGFKGDVAFEFKGDPAAVRKPGSSAQPVKPLAGLIRTTPEVATEAFREGRCFLTLEDGREWTLKVVAYSSGADHVYVEAQPS